MLRFDESRLVLEVRRLGSVKSIVFSASCATRLWATIQKCEIGRDNIREILSNGILNIWNSICSRNRDRIYFQKIIDSLISAIPNEDNGFSKNYYFLLEDAIAATAYTLRGIVIGEAQESVWAARRVYESLDRFETIRLGVREYDSLSESTILNSNLIQIELSRQQRDINELQSLDRDIENLVLSFKGRAESELAIPQDRI
jgi:ferritin-like protein